MSVDAWHLTLACTRAEAEAIAGAEIEDAVLVATEEDEAAERWRLDAYFDGEPAPSTLAAVRALVATPGDAAPAPLADQDWVTLSQAGLEPIRTRRFTVHTTAHPAPAPEGGRAFLIEAGQAFGTGHHATTAGCLEMLEVLADGDRQFATVVDLGTGTGLLAFAASYLWFGAAVTATDIDPIAIEVTRDNAAANDVALAPAADGVTLVVADGARDPDIERRAPYDLVIANILAAGPHQGQRDPGSSLAAPLIAMAPEIAAIAAPEAAIVLAGLLTTQAPAVEAAYAAAACSVERRLERGDWTILLLRAPRERVAVVPAGGDRRAWTTDG